MIVKMLHLDLVCLSGDAERTLGTLRDMGFVHLDLASASGEAVQSAKAGAEDAEAAVRAIRKRRGKLRPSRLERREPAEVLALERELASLASGADSLRRLMAKYGPYGDFDPDLARKLIDAGVDLASVADLPSPLPEKRLSAMADDLAKTELAAASVEEKIASSDDGAIAAGYPGLADRIAFEAARELFGTQGAVSYISGWIPAPDAPRLRMAAANNSWGWLLREPADGETPPTLVEPPRMFRSMKALFAGLGIAPAYTEADVSVPFMCYFSVFFAMLVGDGAYGAIFLTGTLLARRRLPKAWFTLLAVFSSATIVWGLLSNTWFGASIPACRDWPTVKWLGDATYHNMMLLCFTIGVSHLMLARLWNGICRVPDSTAVAEFGWAGILLFMYLVTNSIVGIFPCVPQWGIWTFAASLVCVFGFSVKPSELKTRGAELGMLPLNIMSALGDIISYVRLFAVGLASVKVAENFNEMATGFDLPLWLKVVPMVAILAVGHGLNLAMAALSILVHAVRLNTLEFSNHKGVSWSGFAFSPFRRA